MVNLSAFLYVSGISLGNTWHDIYNLLIYYSGRFFVEVFFSSLSSLVILCEGWLKNVISFALVIKASSFALRFIIPIVIAVIGVVSLAQMVSKLESV